MVHLLFLHQTGRRNPLGLNRNFDKISFHPYFSLKDLFGFFIILFIFRRICFFYPWALGDPENFLPANPLVTPVHIQPEWYFLLAYAILRSIPNKLGGSRSSCIINCYFINLPISTARSPQIKNIFSVNFHQIVARFTARVTGNTV